MKNRAPIRFPSFPFLAESELRYITALFLGLHPRTLEISAFAKLHALCLHSRQIYSTLTRSLHVVPARVLARTANPKNMNWSTSVYTTLSSDTEPSIVITFDSAKYIFNAGENTTRAIIQSKRGWRKLKALFLTQLKTQRSSGVPGMSSVSLLRVRSSHRRSLSRSFHVGGR